MALFISYRYYGVYVILGSLRCISQWHSFLNLVSLQGTKQSRKITKLYLINSTNINHPKGIQKSKKMNTNYEVCEITTEG